MQFFIALIAAALLAIIACVSPIFAQPQSDTYANPPLPTVARVIASKTDLWADAALHRPQGPTYDFFANLLPPLRYVDANFHEYPIVLSAPGAAVKARLISNGSMINALAHQPAWATEAGTPVRVFVGPRRIPFGADPSQTQGPTYEGGYLPIVDITTTVDGATYREESFAATDPALAAHGVVYLRFTLLSGDAGNLELQIENSEPLLAGKSGDFHDKAGRVYLCADSNWKLKRALNSLMVTLHKGESATAAIPTDAIDSSIPAAAAAYNTAHSQAVNTWQNLLDNSTQISVPEPIVNNAWRSLICGSYALLKGDVICYSANNAYGHLYEAEGGDAAKSLLLFGRTDDVRKMIVPLLDFLRPGLEFHEAGLKLQLLSSYYWLTHDANFIRQQEPRWQKEVDRITSGREKETGLLPKEKYAGDIETKVYSLNSNANCWRGLRDLSAVLRDIGENEKANQIAATAADFRKTILAAVDKSERRDVTPHFVPVALFGEEQPHDMITATRPGSYYDLIIPYVLGSGVFPYDSEPATAIIQYLQQHGGLAMGMIRTGPEPGFWIVPANLDDLYGIRYDLAILERDEPDRALVTFYAKLAQGLTRNTFIGAEGTCLTPLDQFGRQMYLPPNSASNAHFLYLMRYCLIQDWDLNDDGVPDTLRLLFATPRAWLADGQAVIIRKAPTAFGEISLKLQSHLSQGTVTIDITLPPIAPTRTVLRLRMPDGYHLNSAIAGNAKLQVAEDDSLDLSSLHGQVHVDAKVSLRK